MSKPDTDVDARCSQQQALQIAFQTMQERCQQLQKRLSIVEEENMGLKIERGIDKSEKIVKENSSNETINITNLQKKVEELTKQKSQLTHHVFMVAAENRQLWSRLTRLTRTNKKQHSAAQPSEASKNLSAKGVKNENSAESWQNRLPETGRCNTESSLEEISLRLINSIMMEKSELEQYTEMIEMQNGTEINLQNVGFTYPEDNSRVDSLQQLKQHDLHLSQTKRALMVQQMRLKIAIRNLKKMKQGSTCKNCRWNASKTVCQIGTQFDSDDSLREHGATQTSFPPSPSLTRENQAPENLSCMENSATSQNICPLCGTYFVQSTSFQTFHEHVINHFTKDKSLESFEIVR